MTNSELLMRLSKIKRNSFKEIPNSEMNKIVESLKDEDLISLVPGIHEDIDKIIFKYCFYSRKELKEQLAFVSPYLRFLNSWYDVDCCLAYITSPIDFDSYLPQCLTFIQDKNPFIRRLGYVLLLKADLKDPKIDSQIIKLIKNDDNINVRMAEGWLLSFMMIKCPDYMLEEFSKGEMPYPIARIGISKSLDSFCVSVENKNRLKLIRFYLKEEIGGK